MNAEPAGEQATDTMDAPYVSPYDRRGDWYVINSYSGYEKKVKADLETRIKTMHLQDKIFEIVIPTDDVVEYERGKKRTVTRKTWPGYVLIRMYLDNETWGVVRNTTGVSGFVGGNSSGGTRPIYLSRREVEKILGGGSATVREEAPAKVEIGFDVGDAVKVVTGPFADFDGVVEQVDAGAGKLKVLVDIFGRETPIELTVDQVVKP